MMTLGDQCGNNRVIELDEPLNPAPKKFIKKFKKRK